MSLFQSPSNGTAARASVGKDAQATTDGETKINNNHYHFIHSMILPATLHIQKELRGRKFKEVQAKLTKTIELLEEFQDESWEPESHPAASKTAAPQGNGRDSDSKTDASDGSSSSSNNNNNNSSGNKEETFDTTGDSDSDSEEATTTTELTEEMADNLSFFKINNESSISNFVTHGNNDDETHATTTTSATDGTTDTSGSVAVAVGAKQTKEEAALPIEDDPLTRMKMHKTVSVALDAYTTIISHPQMVRSSSRVACEKALTCIEQLVIREYVGGRAGGKDDPTASGSAARSEQASSNKPSRMHQLLGALNKCSESALKMKMPSSVHSHISQCVRAMMTSPRCGIHEASMLFGIRIAFYSHLVSNSKAGRKSSKEALLDVVEHYLHRLETDPRGASPSSLWYTDCFVMMRTLIKLSSKELLNVDATTTANSAPKQSYFWADPHTEADHVALNNKILSLELQRRAIECAGPVFCNGDKFIQLIQSQNGSIALFKNCMSPCTQVAYISQQVFLIMCYKFKHHIKDEMQAFMSNIFFRVIESQNSSFTQKALVLESLRTLCKDPFLLSQIFLNYDCGMDSENLYKDIVLHLAQLCAKSTMAWAALVAGGGGRAKQKEADENASLSLAGCEVLVGILQAFLEALGIPANSEYDDEVIDSAGKKIRSDLNIEEIVASSKLRSSNFARFRQIREDMARSAVLTVKGVGDEHGERSEAEDVNDDDLTGSILDFFEKKRSAEKNLEIGAVKFTMDLKEGLRFFIKNGFVSCDAEEIARFFIVNKDRLDKTQMGEALGREPDSAFIKGQKDLDPDKGGPGFFCRILHYYAEALDFTGMFFAEAIRLFLSGFRLPGEAQKIDRIMENFAERFTVQNPDVFPSADTAFILAFSVIMLNTDLHNPSIKEERRMTKDSFIRNNRGIGENGADLDPAFLTKIFNRIKENPFSLKEDDHAREKAAKETAKKVLGESGGLLGGGLFGATTEERKKMKFEKEREDMVNATELLIRRKKGRTVKAEKLTDAVDPAHVVKPMFDVTWGAIIGTLSQVMECSNDEQSIAVCLTGFVYAIRISAHSNMSLARDTFLGSLAKFTYLGSVKELKYKNVEIIRTLVSIAVTDGEYLGESWGPVLQCISQLARMRMSASGLDNDETFLQDSMHSPSPVVVSRKDLSSSRTLSSRTRLARETAFKETESTNSRIILNEIGEELIDQVFSSSVKLSAPSLALFIEQLIAVANSEIEGQSKRGITGVSSSMHGSTHGEAGPSIFSMQRLVEVADYNMHLRPRLVWAQIWDPMAGFFFKNGCHNNSMVSAFAIDALKQLSLKFLEKPEASEFHFQRLFLDPFLLIMKDKNTQQDTREVILACVEQMIHLRVDNLKSGWRIFFDILLVGSKDRNNKVSLHALSILQGTIDKHLDSLSILANKDDESETSGTTNRNSDAEDFLAMCRASLSFIDCEKTHYIHPIGVSMRALCHVAIYADLIASKKVLPPVSGAQFYDPGSPGYTYEGLSPEEALEMVLWRPLFEGLAEGAKTTTRSREDGIGNLVQRGSVLALRAILLRHGSIFSDAQLGVVIKETVIPAFQIAVESDTSPIISIASESPSLSSLHFLASPLPVPPACDNEGLLKFELVSQQSDRNPRSMGQAELLLEATFTDMRNGGGGDLSKAYKFAKKDMESKQDTEQPFPDSWISTTAPIALGALTDLSSEVLLPRGAGGASMWRSCVGEIFLQWCNGDITRWVPCEAVVRITTSELDRFMKRVTNNISNMAENKKDANAWANQIIEFYSEVMGQNLGVEQDMMDMLMESKNETLNRVPKPSPAPTVSKVNAISSDASSESGESSEGSSESGESSDEESSNEESSDENGESSDNEDEAAKETQADDAIEGRRPSDNEEKKDEEVVVVANGPPASVEIAEVELPTPPEITELESAAPTKIIKLDYDVLQYRSNADKNSRLPVDALAKLDEKYNTPDSPDWMKLLPALKLRCMAAHFLQQILLLSLREEELIGFVSHQTISNLLKILNVSRAFAEDAVKNEVLAHAFQEAMFNEWGISEEMGEEALENVARLNNTQGSAMFFLTQTAGATNGVIRLLTTLYDHESIGDSDDENDDNIHGDCWDRKVFADQYLVKIIEDIFRKFAESEAKEGHKVDPNVWRNSSESGVKVAIYCTSFCSVVVGLLRAMLSFEPALIERNKGVFFPLVCELVVARSEEIRKLVRQVLTEKFGPLLGLGQDTRGRRPIKSSAIDSVSTSPKAI